MKLFELSGINHNEFVDLVKSKCSEYLKHSSPGFSLYRGAKDLGFYDFTVPRRDRKPRDTPLNAHRELDELFNHQFGFRYRSGGVFASPAFSTTKMYSDSTYVIFPVDGYVLCGSNLVSDLVSEIETSGTIATLQLKFSSFVTYKVLEKEELYEYETLLYTKSNRTPEENKRLTQLNSKIFSHLRYFEDKSVSSFGHNEVMVQCDGYYSAHCTDDDDNELLKEIYENV